MKSGWIINFKNGTRILLNEKAYEKYEKETPLEDVKTEEHWFNFDEAHRNNIEIDVVEL